MQNNLIDKKIVDQKLETCGISDMEDATNTRHRESG